MTGENSSFEWFALIGYRNGATGRRFLIAYNWTRHYAELNANNKFGLVGAYVQTDIQPEVMYHVKLKVIRNDGNDRVIATVLKDGDEFQETETTSNQAGLVRLFRLDPVDTGIGQRIGRNKIVIDGVVVRDFLPVRKNGVGYMYDTVSKELFGNSGTGAFILGPDV